MTTKKISILLIALCAASAEASVGVDAQADKGIVEEVISASKEKKIKPKDSEFYVAPLVPQASANPQSIDSSKDEYKASNSSAKKVVSAITRNTSPSPIPTYPSDNSQSGLSVAQQKAVDQARGGSVAEGLRNNAYLNRSNNIGGVSRASGAAPSYGGAAPW